MTKTIDSTPQAGNLVSVGTPKMLTLTKKPANTTAFKVMRSDETQGETSMSKPTATVARRVRRSAANPIMALTFPADFTADDIASTLEAFGMADYTVSKNEDNLMVALRSDLTSISNLATTSIKLNDKGVMATVARSDANTSGYASVKVVGFEFGGEHTAETATAWLKRNGVDIAAVEPENPDAAVVVKRSEVAEGQEVRRMDLGDDVIVVIVQADELDAPDPIAEAVTDTAYGSWGWGFLDFNMAMADAEFCDAMDDSIYRLQGVLRNIMFYSNLPIDARKQLVENALTQYSSFVIGIMDSLPRQVMTAVARSAPHKESTMSTTTQAAAATAAAATTEKADEQVTIKRSELDKMIADAIATNAEQQAAKLAAEPVTLTRGELDKLLSDAKAAAAAPAKSEAEKLAEVVRSEIAPVAERLAKLEGTTVIRNVTDPAQEPREVKRGDEVPRTADGKKNYSEIFRGAVPGLHKRSVAHE